MEKATKSYSGKQTENGKCDSWLNNKCRFFFSCSPWFLREKSGGMKTRWMVRLVTRELRAHWFRIHDVPPNVSGPLPLDCSRLERERERERDDSQTLRFTRPPPKRKICFLLIHNTLIIIIIIIIIVIIISILQHRKVKKSKTQWDRCPRQGVTLLIKVKDQTWHPLTVQSKTSRVLRSSSSSSSSS